MITCSNCQTVNPDSYLFCQSCGSSLPIAIVDDEIELELEDTDLVGSQGSNDLKISIPMPTKEGQTSEEPMDADGDLWLKEVETEATPEIAGIDTFMAPITESLSLQDVVYGGKTDVGKKRKHNEDDFVTIFQNVAIEGKSQISDRSRRGLFVVCDGMGGHENGEVASAIAINSIIEQFRPFWIDTLPGQKKMIEILHKLNQDIYQQNEQSQKTALERMGTTLAMLAIHDEKVMIAHVGDSRVYRVTGNSLGNVPKLEQLTRDHEVLNQLLDLGVPMAEALNRPDANQLTQALGPNSKAHVEPDINFFTVTEPTLFLLCSDGLSDHDLIEQNWRSHLLPVLNQEIDLQTGLEQMINLGNQINGHDNLTAVMVLYQFTNV